MIDLAKVAPLGEYQLNLLPLQVCPFQSRAFNQRELYFCFSTFVNILSLSEFWPLSLIMISSILEIWNKYLLELCRLGETYWLLMVILPNPCHRSSNILTYRSCRNTCYCPCCWLILTYSLWSILFWIIKEDVIGYWIMKSILFFKFITLLKFIQWL